MKWRMRYTLAYMAIFTAGYALGHDGWWSWVIWLLAVAIGAWVAAPIRDVLIRMDVENDRSKKEVL